MVNGRPRKTQEELDKEMEDYWGSRNQNEGANGQAAPAAAPEAVTSVAEDDDIDMIT